MLSVTRKDRRQSKDEELLPFSLTLRRSESRRRGYTLRVLACAVIHCWVPERLRRRRSESEHSSEFVDRYAWRGLFASHDRALRTYQLAHHCRQRANQPS